MKEVISTRDSENLFLTFFLCFSVSFYSKDYQKGGKADLCQKLAEETTAMQLFILALIMQTRLLSTVTIHLTVYTRPDSIRPVHINDVVRLRTVVKCALNYCPG